MAEAHRWRQSYGIDPFREWGRRVLPHSLDGNVIVDLDVAVRHYGPNYQLDRLGDLMLIEKKEFEGRLTPGEMLVYDSIDRLAKQDSRFRGWYLLRIRYTELIPTCSGCGADGCKGCGAPVMSADAAYRFFLSAQLEWDNRPISHAVLQELLEGRLIP